MTAAPSPAPAGRPPVRFRAEKFVLCVVLGRVHHKLVQLVFSKTDGSIFVSFPYYKHTSGLVSVGTIAPNSDQLDLKERGKIASHLVKYVHHPSGEAHFSQDGKVFTRIRRQAVPLDTATGHLFTVHVVGFEAFDMLGEAAKTAAPTAKRTILNYHFPDPPPPAIKVVGQLFTEATLIAHGDAPPDPGPIWTVDQNGLARLVFLVSPASGRPGEHRVVALSAEKWVADHGDTPSLSFIGGFDPPDRVLDVSKSTELLALIYPVESEADLRAEIGTIDFAPPDAPV